MYEVRSSSIHRWSPQQVAPCPYLLQPSRVGIFILTGLMGAVIGAVCVGISMTWEPASWAAVKKPHQRGSGLGLGSWAVPWRGCGQRGSWCAEPRQEPGVWGPRSDAGGCSGEPGIVWAPPQPELSSACCCQQTHFPQSTVSGPISISEFSAWRCWFLKS